MNITLFIYLFLERGRKGERGGETHQCVVVSCAPPTGDLACNPGMCSDWELNQQFFGSQASTQSTEPHQPWMNITLLVLVPCVQLDQRILLYIYIFKR